MAPSRVLTGKRVLVVEDNPVIKIGLEELLRSAGAMIVRSFDQKVDAAVLDINLGEGVTVLPVAERLRQRNVPFVFYSGQSRDYLAQVREKFPTTTIIQKPADAKRIVSEVARLWGLDG